MTKANAATNRPITKESTRRRKIERLYRHLRMHGTDHQANEAVKRLSK